MALSEAEIEGAGADAWSGKPGALAYESESAVGDWLARRGATFFQDLGEAEKEAKLILATEAGEDAIRRRFRGAKKTSDQALLFPAHGAYDNSGRLIPLNGAPEKYLAGIRWIAEAMAEGTFMKAAGPLGIQEERTRWGAVVYRNSSDPGTIQSAHPEIWRNLRIATPRFL